MRHFLSSLIFGVVTLFIFLVASKIMNEDKIDTSMITSNEMEEKRIDELPDNAIQTLTIDYRETNN